MNTITIWLYSPIGESQVLTCHYGGRLDNSHLHRAKDWSAVCDVPILRLSVDIQLCWNLDSNKHRIFDSCNRDISCCNVHVPLSDGQIRHVCLENHQVSSRPQTPIVRIIKDPIIRKVPNLMVSIENRVSNCSNNVLSVGIYSWKH